MLVLGLDKRQHTLDLLLGADHAQHVAREDAHIARRNRMQLAGTQDAYNVHAIARTQVQVA